MLLSAASGAGGSSAQASWQPSTLQPAAKAHGGGGGWLSAYGMSAAQYGMNEGEAASRGTANMKAAWRS